MNLESEDRFYIEHKEQIDAIAEHYRAIIELLGEDVSREGLQRTPYRAAKALVEVTQGYKQNPEKLVEQAMFDYAGKSVVVERYRILFAM